METFNLVHVVIKSNAWYFSPSATLADEAQSEPWLPQRVNSEAACAVVQSLGRFMASYFTNQPLAVFPPHNVDVLPPLHLPQRE